MRHNLKKTLRNNQNVAWLKCDIARNITISNQIREMNRISILLAIDRADDHGVISCRIPGQATDRYHRVEHRHVSAIRKRARLGGFADDSHLFGDRTDKSFHDDRDQRFFDISTESLFVFASERGRRLADRDDVFDERDRKTPIRPHGHGYRQLWVTPHEDVQVVARTDAVLGRWQR